MADYQRSLKLLSLCGGIGIVLGSLDPLEGSILIVPGSGLLALGGYLAHEGRRTVGYRTAAFILVALGVGAMFGLSALGGIGGTSGRSALWAMLVLPYVVGWSLDLWGPGSPRWLSVAGIGIGCWYLAILVLMLRRPSGGAHGPSAAPATALAAIGLATIVACAFRLWQGRRPEN